jgi:hypothetical protein
MSRCCSRIKVKWIKPNTKNVYGPKTKRINGTFPKLSRIGLGRLIEGVYVFGRFKRAVHALKI